MRLKGYSSDWRNRIADQLGILLGVRRRRQRRATALIAQSALFDRDWYLEQYPDVASSGVNPARHYLDSGWQEGRDPGPRFSTTAYLRANADVAALGINPLLHFVEHGHSEGRGALDQTAPARMPRVPIADFGPAAPCASFRIDAPAPIRWKARAPIDDQADDELTLDGRWIGKFAGETGRRRVRNSIDLLARLSSGPGALTPTGDAAPTRLRLADAWHCGRARIRTRWAIPEGVGATVVRAIAFEGGEPKLVGEGLVRGALDLVDAKLANPFMPVLFVFVTAEGDIVGEHCLAFPSLCRGGAHYPEYLVLAKGQGGAEDIDTMGVSDRLFRALRDLRGGTSAPLVGSIAVDLEGADGTHPFFQVHFQEWLRRVVGVAVEPIAGAMDRASSFLHAAVRVAATGSRADATNVLNLSSDMIPSICALVAAASDKPLSRTSMVVPFVAASQDLSQPSRLFSVPGDWSHGGLAGFIPAYPRFESATGAPFDPGLGVAAIRMPRSRALSEAELLAPVAAGPLVPNSDDACTWLIGAGPATDEDFLETLQSLALQAGGPPARLMLLATPTPTVAALAQKLFPMVSVAGSIDDAASRCDTRLVGYIAPGLVLHDRAASAVMAAALDDPNVASASVVILSIDKRGRGWIVAPVDAGELAIDQDRHDAAFALDLWRSAWPVRRPPRGLWMTTAPALAQWLTQKDASGAQHICTSVVSAAYRGVRPQPAAALTIPPAQFALAVEHLVG